MKRIDFDIECPTCGVLNLVPLKVEDRNNVHDGANFSVVCAGCTGVMKVHVKLDVEAERIVLN